MVKNNEFHALSAALESLTPHQKHQLIDHLHKLEHIQAVNLLIEHRLLAVPSCPHCHHPHFTRWGSASGLQRYRCVDCHSTFNALTGTPLARLRHKAAWLEYAQQLADGQSIRKSAVICDVHRNTAFRWRHRFLMQPNTQKPTTLAGIAETDETFFLESFKVQKKNMIRKPRKRGGKASKRGLSSGQIPVLVCRDRTGETADFTLEKADQIHISDVLKPLLAADAIISMVVKHLGLPFEKLELPIVQLI